MLTLYHMPQTRSTGVWTLLEELGAPFEMHVLDRPAGEHRGPEFLALNPLGKVPTIVHDGAVVTEQVAVYAYLADAFPERGLAPPIGDRLRGPYLRWLAFYGSSFEPAMVDKYRGQQPDPADPRQVAMSPYGGVEAVIDALAAQFSSGPFMLGERFTAADILWGSAMGWMLSFNLLPARAPFIAYAQRIADRPSSRKVMDEDAALAALQTKT